MGICNQTNRGVCRLSRMITMQVTDKLKGVIVSVIFAKAIPLGIPRCNCNQRGFPQEMSHLSGESIWQGIQYVIVLVVFKKIVPHNKQILHVPEAILMTRVSDKFGYV